MWLFKYTKCSAVFFCFILAISLQFPEEPGFNAGLTLSNTSQGIKAQITSGTISQKSDNDKIMYTIPSLPGSSGSPVVNEKAQLVAVNFAGVNGTQSFNYGIQIKKVRQFMNEN